MLKHYCVLVALFSCSQWLTEARVDSASVSELSARLRNWTMEAELLFNHYSSKSVQCMQAFMKKSHTLGDDLLDKIDPQFLTYGPSHCRTDLAKRVKQIRHNSHIEAEYNAANHQKFFLGYMIVQRVHLNKTALFLKRAEGCLRTCGSSCETPSVQNKLLRWYKTASHELGRVSEDVEGARLAYKDLLTHAGKRLGRIERKALQLIEAAVRELYKCGNKV